MAGGMLWGDWLPDDAVGLEGGQGREGRPGGDPYPPHGCQERIRVQSLEAAPPQPPSGRLVAPQGEYRRSPSWLCSLAVGAADSWKALLSPSTVSLPQPYTHSSLPWRMSGIRPPTPFCKVAGRVEWGDMWRVQPQEWHPGMAPRNAGKMARGAHPMRYDQMGQAGAAELLGERWPLLCP